MIITRGRTTSVLVRQRFGLSGLNPRANPGPNRAPNSIPARVLSMLLSLLLLGVVQASCSIGTDSQMLGIADFENRIEDFTLPTEPDHQTDPDQNPEATSDEPDSSEQPEEAEPNTQPNSADSLGSGSSGASPNIIQDFRSGLDHGEKGPEYQRYIVLHDTEGSSGPASVISWWDSNGNYVAAHFVIGRDGSIYQCVPMNRIAHHAGYGEKGKNAQYGLVEDGRDDRRGTPPPGSYNTDYAMNSYSIGIELVHVGGGESYPIEQLEALDSLIAYIDNYYGFESQIIDHKTWVNGNSDTSPEFAQYLRNYQDHRSYH